MTSAPQSSISKSEPNTNAEEPVEMEHRLSLWLDQVSSTSPPLTTHFCSICQTKLWTPLTWCQGTEAGLNNNLDIGLTLGPIRTRPFVFLRVTPPGYLENVLLALVISILFWGHNSCSSRLMMCSCTSKERPVPGHHPVLDQSMAGCTCAICLSSCTKTSACSKRHTIATVRIKSISFKGKFWYGSPKRRWGLQ